jgi:hypothetical protein
MKKTLGLVVLLLVALVAFAVPVAAQTASGSAEAVQEARPALAIKAPQIASVGEKVQIKVVALPGGAPVGGAGVWAVDINKSDDLTSTSSSELDRIGIFMGWTDTTGVLGCVFQNVSKYLLVSCKDGYNPGFAWIKIQPPKDMAIRNPETVQVLEPVSIRVVEKSVMPVETPVSGAGVWAVTYINTLASLTDYDAVAAIGIFLGWTDLEGYVSPKPYFADPGKYYLVAFKAGFVPAISQIKVIPLKEMAIKGPETAYTGQTCEFTVYETNGGGVVAGAGVWAMLNQNQAELSNLDDNAVDMIIQKGIFLGWTNNQGQVFHAFDKPGKYLLVATKQGYKPAFSKISILEVKELAVRNPETVRILAAVPIRVVEKSVLTVEIPVAGAGVWAISLDKAARLNEIPDYTDFAKSNGIFLGLTDQTGYVMPYPRFSAAGQYWLVAIKDGYAPGVSRITVVVPTPVTATPVTVNSAANKNSSIAAKK